MKVLLFCAVAASLCLGAVSVVYAVDPNPLENAYWRFEEGTDGTKVPEGAETVLDSINANHMQRWPGPEGSPTDVTAPDYVTDVPAAVIPQTGAPNTLALDFSPHSGGGDDIYTVEENIDNPLTTGYTLEASFKLNAVGGPFQGLVCKEAQSGDLGNLPVLALKVRGDNNLLQIEQFDGSGVARQVSSLDPIVAGTWYHAAAVNDGSTLSLYLMGGGGGGYALQGTDIVSGTPIWQGGEGVDDFDTGWSIGRAEYAGGPADWTDGVIDEVRLSNQALSPSEFLWVPEPATLLLLAFGGSLVLRRRRSQSGA